MPNETCPTCKGDREVEFCTTCNNEVENCTCDDEHYRFGDMRPCPECNGAGELESDD